MTRTRTPGHRLLHAPGPTHVPDAVLAAMHRPSMDLVDPRLQTIVADCEDGLRWLAGAAGHSVFMYSSNGHGMWECLIENLLPPGGTALIPGTGHFSDGWAQQTEMLGRQAQRTPWIEGRPIDPAAVAEALRADREHRIAAVFVVHTDTASGVTSDLDALRRALDEAGHPALFVVDAVASLGATAIDMRRQRIDVLMSASQKGLMLPPGLGIAIASEHALQRMRANPAPRGYWDMVKRIGTMNYEKFFGTPPLQMLYGLQEALALLRTEGLDNVFARHRQLAAAVQAAVSGWAEGGQLSIFCSEPAARSVSVTTIATAPDVDPDALRTLARERFDVACAGGLGPLFGRAFRIGHLGDLNAAMVLGAVAGVEAALRVLKVPIGPGAERAIAALSAD